MLKLKRFEDRSRKSPWGVAIYRDGIRIKRKYFKTRQEREDFIAENSGDLGEQWTQIQELCNEHDLNPLEAIKDYIRDKFPDKTVILKTAIQECLDYKIKTGISKDHLSHVKGFLNKFESEHKGKYLFQFNRHNLENWLLDKTSQATTFKNYRSYLNDLFKYSYDREYVRENPVTRIPLLKKQNTPIDFLSVEEAETLMHLNQDYFTPYLALQLFAGIRPSATWRMDQSMLKSDRKIIDLPANIMKGGRRHLMEGLEPNLWEWLKLQNENTWQMTERQLKRRKEKAMENAGLTHRKNVLRHSFATYLCALDQSTKRCSYLMSHRDLDVIYQNYKEIATQEEAKRFFSIVPKL